MLLSLAIREVYLQLVLTSWQEGQFQPWEDLGSLQNEFL